MSFFAFSTVFNYAFTTTTATIIIIIVVIPTKF